MGFERLLIYLTGVIYAKLNNVGLRTLKKQQDFNKSHVSVISTTQLGNNKTLHVVELDGKRMLIGASSGAMQLIKDLGSVSSVELDEEYSHIEIPNIKIPKIEIPKVEKPEYLYHATRPSSLLWKRRSAWRRLLTRARSLADTSVSFPA